MTRFLDNTVIRCRCASFLKSQSTWHINFWVTVSMMPRHTAVSNQATKERKKKSAAQQTRDMTPLNRQPLCSLATRLFCQRTCTVKGRECCSVSLVVQEIVYLDPILLFWPHFDKILATWSTMLFGKLHNF